MKNTINTKKILLMITIILTLSTSFMVFYYSMVLKGNSVSFQSITYKESMQTMSLKKPKSSTVSLNIRKTANILDGNAHDVMIVGSLAYVADEFGGLRIIDISDPTAPVEMGQFDDGGSAEGLYVSGGYAYVVGLDDGLEIIDITDPTDPAQVGQFEISGEPLDVYISGSYAFIAHNVDGLLIINISDPTAPSQVGQFNEGGFARDVYVSGSYAYVADGSNGLVIIDISNPI